MRGYSSIYTDGHSLDVSAADADELRRRGLIEPHPGAGSDGITAGDWRLTPEASWDDVTGAMMNAARVRLERRRS